MKVEVEITSVGRFSCTVRANAQVFQDVVVPYPHPKVGERFLVTMKVNGITRFEDWQARDRQP